MKILATLILAAASLAHAEVKIGVGEISDKRTTGQFFAGLEIVLKVSGPELAECKGLRVAIKEAKDDSGKVLKEKESGFRDGGFEPPQKAFGGNDSKADEFELKFELENPARAAKTVTLGGALELLIPSKDPAAVITASIAKDSGKPLPSEALKKAGAKLTLTGVKEDNVTYTISDPNNKVASVEFCSADGKVLETSGRMSSGFGGMKEVSVSMRNTPPKDAVAKIYLVTEKSLVTVPVALKAVALP